MIKQGKSILKFKFMVKCIVWSLQYTNIYVVTFNLFCWSISRFLQQDKAILTKKKFFGVKHLSGAIFAGVRSQFCRGSELSPAGFAALLRGSQLRCEVWSNILPIQRFGAMNSGVHGRRALPPSVDWSDTDDRTKAGGLNPKLELNSRLAFDGKGSNQSKVWRSFE